MTLVVIMEGAGSPFCRLFDGAKGAVSWLQANVAFFDVAHFGNKNHWTIDDEGKFFGYVGQDQSDHSLRAYYVTVPPRERGKP